MLYGTPPKKRLGCPSPCCWCAEEDFSAWSTGQQLLLSAGRKFIRRSALEFFEQFPLLETFQKGGPVMWPLLLLSVIALGFIIERFVHYRKAGINTDEFLRSINEVLKKHDYEAAEELCEQTRGPIASIISSGLRRVEKGKSEVERAIEQAGGLELARLERGLTALSAIYQIAPMMGFLGTVYGMIVSFDVIAKQGLNNPQLVAGGISQALITTATGLAIAIPVMAAYNFYVAKVNRMVLEMEESSSLLLEHID
jgi:biopolymer transport protein ExbB